MRSILKRLGSLASLARPLALTFIGIVLLSLGVAYFVIVLYHDAALPGIFYYLTLQFLPRWTRGEVLLVSGLAVLGAGIWQLSGVVVIPLTAQANAAREMVLGYRQISAPQIAIIAGGPGLLRMVSLGRQAARLTCITPIQDPVEYYYRASSLSNVENVLYLVPTPAHVQVYVELDDGTRRSIKEPIAPHEQLAAHHAVAILLQRQSDEDGPLPVFPQVLDVLGNADAIILGPGSLFGSILPNLLIPEVSTAIRRSRARTIYVCNLMTEPGLTTGFSVADHIRQIVRVGGFSPNYVLVNAQRIEPEVRRIYEAAHQKPVYLAPEEYEETIVSATDRVTAHEVIVEGAVVIEADLAAAVVQLTASLDQPGESRAVQVLRHDPEKLTAAILAILQRS